MSSSPIPSSQAEAAPSACPLTSRPLPLPRNATANQSLMWGSLGMWVCLLSAAPSVAQSVPEEKLTLKQKLSKAIETEDSATAVKLLTQLIKEQPDNSGAYYKRGCEYFRLGNFQESVQDFDKYIELDPMAERRLWERGISCYFAGMYKEGAEQFALYQTYQDNDVENSIWRFLCMAKTDGLEKARTQMLPIKNDPRVPLMEAYALFQGKSTPEKVLAAAQAGTPTEVELASRMFYAHLYLGLYYEAHGQRPLAQSHLRQAWQDHQKTRSISRYMWHVARVHSALLDQETRSDSETGR